MACSICLEELRAEDIIATLPCGHVFHRYCILAGHLSVRFDGGRTQSLEVLAPKLTACPNCRRAWELKDARLSLLESTWEERAAMLVGALAWERFKDPGTGGVYWVNPSVTECFWEHGDAWTPYVFAGRKWWCKNDEPSTWFFADTGVTS
jgi:hypothetical protein